MRLSTLLPYGAPDPAAAAADIAELERPGLDMVWVAEGYGFDAATTLGYLAASTRTVQLGAGILPIYSRTPTLTAMTAARLDCHPDGQLLIATLSPPPVREISPLAPSLAD